MRRIKTWKVHDDQDSPARVAMWNRDYRLMRAVVRAAEKWRNGSFASGLTDAIDAFNAPEKRK